MKGFIVLTFVLILAVAVPAQVATPTPITQNITRVQTQIVSTAITPTASEAASIANVKTEMAKLLSDVQALKVEVKTAHPGYRFELSGFQIVPENEINQRRLFAHKKVVRVTPTPASNQIKQKVRYSI